MVAALLISAGLTAALPYLLLLRSLTDPTRNYLPTGALVLLMLGAHVIGVVRNPDRVPELARQGVELRKADLGERDRLAVGFAGADAYVSNAALFALAYRRWQDHERANIDGTRNVLAACRDAGVRRVVVRPAGVGVVAFRATDGVVH